MTITWIIGSAILALIGLIVWIAAWVSYHETNYRGDTESKTTDFRMLWAALPLGLLVVVAWPLVLALIIPGSILYGIYQGLKLIPSRKKTTAATD